MFRQNPFQIYRSINEALNTGPSLHTLAFLTLLWSSVSVVLHTHPRQAPTPHAILSSIEIYASMPFSNDIFSISDLCFYFIPRSIGVGPHAYMTDPVTPCCLIASITVPLVPTEPSSVAITSLPYFSSSLLRNISASL